jgi:hypothetical protein
MNPLIPENGTTCLVHWNPVTITDKTMPPRDPNDDDDDEDEEDEDDEDDEDIEPTVVREPDSDE